MAGGALVVLPSTRVGSVGNESLRLLNCPFLSNVRRASLPGTTLWQAKSRLSSPAAIVVEMSFWPKTGPC